MDEYPPTPNAVPVFFKTPDGCVLEHRDPEAATRVEIMRRVWAEQYRREHGDFPPIADQLDFVVRLQEEEEEAARRRAIMGVAPEPGE